MSAMCAEEEGLAGAAGFQDPREGAQGWLPAVCATARALLALLSQPAARGRVGLAGQGPAGRARPTGAADQALPAAGAAPQLPDARVPKDLPAPARRRERRARARGADGAAAALVLPGGGAHEAAARQGARGDRARRGRLRLRRADRVPERAEGDTRPQAARRLHRDRVHDGGPVQLELGLRLPLRRGEPRPLHRPLLVRALR
mmetsp:Transcript_20654/g.52439  ORF Transcript_20654/g.52439 Transcript_20654/m.52439 type:complete len:203 (-) Transcript_20654:737-1345(-)